MKRPLLGSVTVPSTELLVLDATAVGLWREDSAGHDADLVDLVFSGPNAVAAGKKFDRDWDPERLYDVPREDADGLAANFVTFCEREGFPDVNVAIAKAQEPFRERARRALGRGGGGVGFVGNWAVVTPGFPADRALDVHAEQIEEGPNEGRWQRVVVELAEGEATQVEELAQVMADSGRIVLGDLRALESWQQEESLDGLGDCVFWGRDAKQLAESLGAPSLEGRAFGWADQPVKEARRLAKKVEQERHERGMQLAVDYRPHSHLFLAMQQIRESPLGAGVVEVGGAKVCVFATTWGDGTFPVFREFDRDGRLLRIRIELAEETEPTIH